MQAIRTTRHPKRSATTWAITAAATLLCTLAAQAQQPAPPQLTYPPTLPDGKAHVSGTSGQLLASTTDTIREGVTIAKTAPTVEMLYFPGQNYPGNPWSNWGDALYANGKFYASIGDHIGPRGTAYVYEYDPATKQLRILANIRRFLETGDASHDDSDVSVRGEPVQRGPGSLLSADENYTPGKIHGRLDMGSDGWLYYATHRGAERLANDEHGYRGDWILRTHPGSGKTEIVAAYPMPRHAMPASILDPKRMIFYAGTLAGASVKDESDHLVAYDVGNGKLLKLHPEGFGRYMIFDPETGRVFWGTWERGVPPKPRMYDPATNEVREAPNVPNVRSATRVTSDGWAYGTSDQHTGPRRSARLWGFNVRTHELIDLGEGGVGTQEYVATMEIDPTERYLYYIPGAHGGSVHDGAPIVQFDLKTRTRKIIAFLNPFLYDTFGFLYEGTYGIALDEKGERLFITANGKRHPDVKAWESCALLVVHIPASERQP